MKYFYFCKGQDRSQNLPSQQLLLCKNVSRLSLGSVPAHVCTVSLGFCIWQLKDGNGVTLSQITTVNTSCIYLFNIYIDSSHCYKPQVMKCFIKINWASEEYPKGHPPNLDLRILFICFIGKFFFMSSVIYQANKINLQLEWTIYFISDCESKSTNLIKRHTH